MPVSTETIASRFDAAALRYGAKPFLRVLPETAGLYGIAEGDLGYAAVKQLIHARAAGYRAAGYGPGVRVGLLLLNRPDFVLNFLALNAVGVSIVPINPDLRAAELEYLIGHSEMAAAVAVSERIADLRAAGAAVGTALAVAGPDEAPPPLGSEREPPALGSETEAAVLYTSGTTGKPKGCVLTNGYFLHAGDWYVGLGGLCDLGEGEAVMLTPLPLAHMNALACSVMGMISAGGCLVMLDRFHPRSWWESVRASGATCLHYLGVMPAILMKADPAASDRDHNLRFGFGAGVGVQLHAAFEERFGFPLIESWAMTEVGVGGCITANREPRKIGSSCFGKPGPEVEVRIVADDGEPAGVDQPGELLVRRAGPDPAYGFFRDYLKDEAATADIWRDGWFHTGDVVRADADGDLHFVDRKKNVIRRSGENIAALEVEEVLKQHAEVDAAAVAPVYDPIRGEEVFACVTLKTKADAAARAAIALALQAWCLRRLAYYKAPGYVAFVEALPLTSTNKVQRGELKVLAQRLEAGGDCHDLRHGKRRAA
ncbi:AMP-binding protein [Algihabitans albus]|uniref:AMP-binding protein n=1 Tax=Algihabitans albus TaxID=2164067 RepID=UPI000E5CFB73|nr:AMP-binding protein [Algihabitans albus]